MKFVRSLVTVMFAGISAAACTDSPTASDTPSVTGVAPSRDVTLDPVIVIGEPKVPACDPYLTLGGCDDDGGECMMSDPGITGPEETGVMGCSGGGGGSGDGGGGGGGGGGGSGGGSTGSPGLPCPDYGCEEPTAYEQGPLLWAACVLAVVGSTYSVDVVADKFVSWWEAQKALDSAQRSLNMTYNMVRSGYEIDPGQIALLEYRVEQARLRRDDAVGAVEEATGVSVLTLLGAAVACGAAAIAPMP